MTSLRKEILNKESRVKECHQHSNQIGNASFLYSLRLHYFFLNKEYNIYSYSGISYLV